MAEPYVREVRIPPAPAPPVRLLPVLSALFVTSFLSSAVLAVLISNMRSLHEVRGSSSTAALLAFYLAPVVVSVVLGAALLPILLREFAQLQLGGVDAALVLLAGGLVSAIIRYASAEMVGSGPQSSAQPTPAAYLSGTLSTWVAAFASYAVSVWLIRRLGTPVGAATLGQFRERRSSGSPLALGAFLVVGVGAVAVLGSAVANPRRGPDQLDRNVAGRYAVEVRRTQSSIFGALDLVATGAASRRPDLLRTQGRELYGRVGVLESTDLLGRPAEKFATALRAFVGSLPRIALLRTRAAQRRALLAQESLPRMYSALAELDRRFAELGIGEPVLDSRRWSVVLRARSRSH